MLELTIDDGTFKEFDQLAKKLSNLDAPLGEIGAFLEFKAKARFRSEQAPDGTKWAPLAPSTLKSKKTTAILRETAILSAGLVPRVRGNTVVIKPSVEYGAYHQLGTKKMPARPFLGFEKDDLGAISKILTRYLEG